MVNRRQLREAVSSRGLLDRTIERIAPSWAANRLRSRMAMAVTRGYVAADRSRNSISGWSWATGDADTDIHPDLENLRGEARDLSRNNPIPRAAINTNVTSVVGAGLVPHPQIDREFLGLSDEEADSIERDIKREWNLFANSKASDVCRELTFGETTGLVLRSVLDSGDVFVLTPSVSRPENPYSLKVQLIEADRVSNADNQADTALLSGGIETNAMGEKTSCHILEGHPGNYNTETARWRKEDFFSKSGRQNVLHVYYKERIGQRRGVPYLAPVIEQLKQLSRYTEAELTAAVVSAFFTVFVKSSTGEGLDPFGGSEGKSTDDDYKMGAGNIIDLKDGDEVSFGDPTRPNKNYDAFESAMVRQISAALGLPYEILAKVFLKSYSASRASMLEAWRHFNTMRKWLVRQFCQPIYNLWFEEAVILGRISAPGFLSGDAGVMAAWTSARWVGPPRGMLDELKEVEGAERRVELGLSTIETEAEELTGSDWEKVHVQRKKEHDRRVKDGLAIPIEQIQEFRR